MHDIDTLDKTDRKLSSAVCRILCGNPAYQAWTVYRKDVNVPARARLLTQYECFMLVIRRHWRQVCKESGVPYKSNPNPREMDQTARVWMNKGHHIKIFQSVQTLNTSGNTPATELLQLIEQVLGKRISERTLRRICDRKGVPPFSRMREYTRIEVQQVMRAVVH